MENTRARKIFEGRVSSIQFESTDLDQITASLPSGLYTSFRTFDSGRRVLGLKMHLNRLYSPSLEMGVIPACSRDELREHIRQLIAVSSLGEVRVRLILDTQVELGAIYILLQPFVELPSEVYTIGVQVDLSVKNRSTPTLKRSSFIAESMKERKEKKPGIFEVLLTHDDEILEGMTSNFFYVKKGVLYTAMDGVLGGVTREMVLNAAGRLGIATGSLKLRIKDIPTIDEAFITSSSRGVVPVVGIASSQIGGGAVGEITNRLRLQYDADVVKEAEVL